MEGRAGEGEGGGQGKMRRRGGEGGRPLRLMPHTPRHEEFPEVSEASLHYCGSIPEVNKPDNLQQGLLHEGPFEAL